VCDVPSLTVYVRPRTAQHTATPADAIAGDAATNPWLWHHELTEIDAACSLGDSASLVNISSTNTSNKNMRPLCALRATVKYQSNKG
jgi:hypothetical protein